MTASLDAPPTMCNDSSVRCGNLTAMEQHQPRVISGAVWSNRRSMSARLPSQGPAPLRTWGFSLAARYWTTLSERSAANGTSRLMGFSVMRSPVRSQVKAGSRIARWEPLNLPIRCTDAVAPGSRDAKHNSDRVSFASPSTVHQEA